MPTKGLSKTQARIRAEKFGLTDELAAIEQEAAKKQLALLKRQQRAMQARDDFMTFVKFTSPDPEDPNDIERSRYKDAKHHRAIAKVIEEVEKGEIQFLILTMPPRHGKLCAHDTLVPTPTGFIRHGDIQPGDYVFGPDGKPTRVVAVSEDATADIEVEFTNGERIVVHENHEWTVYDRRTQPARLKTLETKTLAQDFWIGPQNVRGGRARWQLPDTEALDFPTAVQPLHPYTLGVWLGDGSATKPHITGVDEEVFSAVAECSGFHETARWRHATTGVTTVSFAGPRPGVRGQLSAALGRLGVKGDKHIPPHYLRADKTQRLQLLAGLMDTDGHTERDTGRCRIVTCSARLASDIFDLCAGLGFRPYITQQEPTVSSSGITGKNCVFTVGFQPSEPVPVRLERKRMRKFAMRRRVAIRSIQRVDPKPGRCIQVDRPDGLYLVGRSLLPTHNSELVSRRLPAWYLGRHPEENVVVATYNDDFAKDFGADVRSIVQSSAFKQVFPDTRLQRGGSAKDRLQTSKGGMGTFVGLGGSLTGRGAHLLVIDDVIKSNEEARSKSYRDRAWDWFTKVALTRRMGRKLVIITFTRWHEDDIIGRLTDPNNEHYSHALAKKIKIIDLPAIAGDDDPLGRKPGQALWPDGPDNFDLSFLEDLRAVDPLGFEALYQQRPSVADGVLFRREQIRYYDTADLPDGLRIYCASDHAVTTNQRSDSTVLLKVGVDKQNNIYLLDCWWRKARTPEVVEAMLEMARSGEPPLVWWAERGHITQSIGPFLRKRMEETSTFINIVDVTPVGDKEQRAQSISARMAMGYVHFPKDKPWVAPAIEQLMAFPNGKHDDFVDTLAWIGLGLRNMVPGSPANIGKKPPRFGTLNWVKEAQRQDDMRLKLASTGGF